MPEDEKKEESAPDADSKTPEPTTDPPQAHLKAPPRDLPAGISLAVAAILPTLFFLILPPLSKSGLWDPFELNVADLARRLALNLFHADGLSLAGADSSLPHLNDIGRPELPFTSMAIG